MCCIGLCTPNLEPEQTRSLVATSASVCAFIFTFLRRLDSKCRFKIPLNMLGRYLQAGRQRQFRRVVSWLLWAESTVAFLVLVTCFCFSIVGNEMQEHIVSVWYSMSAGQGVGVSVPIHLHLLNGILHIKLSKMLVQFLLSTLQD